jgi:hypothetical protein
MIFKSKKYEPLDYKHRKYFEYNFLWLCDMFPEVDLLERKIFVPNYNDFPIQWNGSENNAFDAAKIICGNMQIPFEDIELYFYQEGVEELNAGFTPIIMQNAENKLSAAGRYHGKNKKGKYKISINEISLKNAERLITTITHELAHVKLMNLKEFANADEHLTDLSTVFFGFGIFTANSSFNFFQNNNRWGYSRVGYLNQDEWAYSLALLAFSREEDKPEWSLYLNKTIKKEFNRCLKYLLENEDEIFKFEDEISSV